MKLAVGLGNPGRKYEATRHNAGFWWVERLALAEKAELKSSARYHGRVARLRAPLETWLLLPDTYMNESGRAVAALANFYKLAAAEILIVHDELDLAPGAAKLKQGGGIAGHNGLSDIASRLGTRDFWRLRIGIGRPVLPAAGAEYVLAPPTAAERAAIDNAIVRSLAVWPLLANGEHEAAMLKLHTRKTDENVNREP
ncbi:MAG: aminoacyl-tRNA hydrolase [Betaproteobacteria bacterium]|nr:aminoacyl-tRNA hydrolase [Betaproteobacteria bacterium]